MYGTTAHNGRLQAAASEFGGYVCDVPLDTGEVVRNDNMNDPKRHLRGNTPRSAHVQAKPPRRLPSTVRRQQDGPHSRTDNGGAAVGPPPRPAVPLADVRLLRSVEARLTSDRVGARAAPVCNATTRRRPRSPAPLERAPLPIRLLRVEEEALVEEPDFARAPPTGAAAPRRSRTSARAGTRPRPTASAHIASRGRERPQDALLSAPRRRRGAEDRATSLVLGIVGGTASNSTLGARGPHRG